MGFFGTSLDKLLAILTDANTLENGRARIIKYIDFVKEYNPKKHSVDKKLLQRPSEAIVQFIAAEYFTNIMNQFKSSVYNPDEFDLTDALSVFLTKQNGVQAYQVLIDSFNDAAQRTNSKITEENKKISLITEKDIKAVITTRTEYYLSTEFVNESDFKKLRNAGFLQSYVIAADMLAEFSEAGYSDRTVSDGLDTVTRIIEKYQINKDLIASISENTIDYQAVKELTAASITADQLRGLKSFLTERGFSINETLSEDIDGIQQRLDGEYKKVKRDITLKLTQTTDNMIKAAFDHNNDPTHGMNHYRSILKQYLAGLEPQKGEANMFIEQELTRYKAAMSSVIDVYTNLIHRNELISDSNGRNYQITTNREMQPIEKEGFAKQLEGLDLQKGSITTFFAQDGLIGLISAIGISIVARLIRPIDEGYMLGATEQHRINKIQIHEE